ncbi:MAG: metallophosphoesterase [Silvanigrellales bacterium]|nr:metallophosphoesterase [Silvanigrellales bacterium]
MIVRFLAAAAVSFLLSALGHYYLYVRLIEPLTATDDHIWPSVFLGLWALTFFGFAIARAVPVLVRRVVELAMFTWMGTAYLFLLLCVLTSPLSLVFHFLGREEAWLSIGILGVGGLLTVYSLWRALSSETVVPCVIPVRSDLPADIETMRVVVLSDIHVAGLVGRRRMRRLVKRVNALTPDVIFVTGDLVDGSVRQLRHDVLPLRGLLAPHGVHYVTGNHEYYCNAARWRAFCADELGWTVLSNSSASFRFGQTPVNVFGIEDRSSLHARHGVRRQDPRLKEAAATKTEQERMGALNILLAHQPKDARLVRSFPWLDLQISGHTHGGQLWPLKIFVVSDQRYNTGLYALETGTQLYVNQGTGFWGPPMRLGTRCEISLLTFQRASEPSAV